MPGSFVISVGCYFPCHALFRVCILVYLSDPLLSPCCCLVSSFSSVKVVGLNPGSSACYFLFHFDSLIVVCVMFSSASCV